MTRQWSFTSGRNGAGGQSHAKGRGHAMGAMKGAKGRGRVAARDGAGDNHVGRNVMAAVAGLTVGFIGSRVLPPLVGRAVGASRARGGADPFQHLIDDHLEIAWLLDEMSVAFDASLARRTKLFTVLKRMLGRHAMAEENVVYPLLEERPGQQDLSRRMYSDHADVKIHLFELEECLRRDKDWSAPVQALRIAVGEHVREEENVVFPLLREALDERNARGLSGLIRREEAMLA